MSKGQVLGGECNMTRCFANKALLWNDATRAYYCAKCAKKINAHNPGLCRRLPHRSLRQIMDDYEKVTREARVYYEEVIQPQLDACKTKEEFEAVADRIVDEACDADGTIRQKPACIEVGLLIERNRWIEGRKSDIQPVQST